MVPNNEEFLTYKEVADFLKVSESQVRKYVNDTKNPLPILNLSPGVIRFRRDHILAWTAGVFIDPNTEIETTSDTEGGEQ